MLYIIVSDQNIRLDKVILSTTEVLSTEVNVSELYAIWETRGRGDILWAYKKEKREKQAVCITPSDAINEKKSK